MGTGTGMILYILVGGGIGMILYILEGSGTDMILVEIVTWTDTGPLKTQHVRNFYIMLTNV